MSGFLARIFGMLTGQGARAAGNQSPAVNNQGSGDVTINYGNINVSGVSVEFSAAQVQELVTAAVGSATQQHAAQIAELARQLAVTQQAAIGLLRNLGNANVPLEQLPNQLEVAATRLLELEKTLAQPIKDDAAAQAARDEARRLIDQGDFEAAAARLRRGRQEARQRREDSQRIEATMAADEAGLAKLALCYRDAAALFTEAADLVRFDAKACWEYLLHQADALYQQGREFGDNAALAESIEIHKQALALAPRDRVPLDWAMTQNNLGNVFATLGEREDGKARLEEAITAYRAALEERTRDRVPLNWAGTQNNLGNALKELGDRDAGTARLKEAVAAYRAALEEWTRDRVPLNWAGTQNNLGNALRTLGEREAGTARLEEAVTAHREALKEYTRDRVPLYWAMTQNNLGGALATLGERESRTGRLEEAVTAYREALKEQTRERVPPAWAGTQSNLANCLATMAESSPTPGPILADAITHMRNAVDGFRQVGDEYRGPIAEQRLAELKAKAQ